MTERESLLTENERMALEVHEALPRAKAIQAWMTYAALQNFDADRLAVGVDEIRNMSGKRLKRVRKDLAAATRLLDDMVAASYENPIQVEQCIAITEVVEVPTPDVLADDDAADEAVLTVDEQPEIESLKDEDAEGLGMSAPDVPAEQGSDDEVEVVGLSETGRSWVIKLFSKYDFDDKSVEAIAQDIYARMGEPKTRNFSGKRIDPVYRITLRLIGKTNSDIAVVDEVSVSAVDQWFRNFVEKRLLKPEDSSEEEPVLALVPTPQTPVFTPLRMQPKRSEMSHAETIDHAKLAMQWATEVGLTLEESELLCEVLDPNFSLEMNGTHKQVRHRFRLYLTSKLPSLESDELGLTSNEIARLGKLLGREKKPEGFTYTAAPQSAHEISMDHGYLVPQNRDELLSALQKVSLYLTPKTESIDDLNHEATDVRQLLITADFTEQEANALLAYVTFDEENTTRERTPDTAEALKRLQRILAQKRKQITDQEITAPGLTMLTNVAFGSKTINDVYYKAHGKDPQITRQQVSDRIIKGIEELIA